jgi:hypothetical protein
MSSVIELCSSVERVWFPVVVGHCRAAASSAWEPRAAPHAPLPFWNGHCLFFSSPINGSIEELHSPPAVSPPQHRLPSLLCPTKGVESLTIHRRINSPPYFGFLLHKNSLSPELKSSLPPLLVARPHLSLHRPELQPVRSPKSPSSFPSIHDELPCITAATHLNSDKFLS